MTLIKACRLCRPLAPSRSLKVARGLSCPFLLRILPTAGPEKLPWAFSWTAHSYFTVDDLSDPEGVCSHQEVMTDKLPLNNVKCRGSGSQQGHLVRGGRTSLAYSQEKSLRHVLHPASERFCTQREGSAHHCRTSHLSQYSHKQCVTPFICRERRAETSL